MPESFMSSLAFYAALFFSAMAAGGVVLFAAAVAPRIHKVLGRADAQALTRAVFPVYYLVLGILCAIAAGCAFAVNVAAGLVLAVIAGGFLFARQAMLPRMNALQDELARGSTVARGAYDALHAWSVRMNILQLGVLILVFWFLALSA